MNIPLKMLRSVVGLGLAAMAVFFPVAANAEFAIGDARAPVTLVEYASLTCGYCVRFHREVLPLIKSRHIDTGRVRFVYRDLPTSMAAIRGAVAARCAGPQQYFAMLDTLYSAAGIWSRERDVDAALIQYAASLGLDRAAFRACLNNPQHALSIDEEQQRATNEHDVLVTPSFLINGKLVRGIRSIDEMDALIEEALLRTRQ